MTKLSPFCYFKTCPEAIRLAVMLYVRFPLSLRIVEEPWHARIIEISHETARFWWNGLGLMFTAEVSKSRIQQFRASSTWQLPLDEVFVKANGERRYL